MRFELMLNGMHVRLERRGDKVDVYTLAKKGPYDKPVLTLYGNSRLGAEAAAADGIELAHGSVAETSRVLSRWIHDDSFRYSRWYVLKYVGSESTSSNAAGRDRRYMTDFSIRCFIKWFNKRILLEKQHFNEVHLGND